jgi:hypothetical protein
MSEGIDKGEGRKGAAKLLGGRICCIVGILFGAGGMLFALLGASANVSSGTVGAAWDSDHRARRDRHLLHGCRRWPHPRRGTSRPRV